MAVLNELDMLDPNNAPNEDSEGSNVEIVDSGSNVEICEETELMKFSRILHDAQQAALAVERAKRIKNKTYTGVLQTTAWHRKHHQGDLAAQGFLAVHEFMKMTNEPKEKKELAFEESQESSDDGIVHHLWSNRSNTSDGTEIERAPAVSEVSC